MPAPRLHRFALIPAAGSGRRMGQARPKQYLDLAGATLLEHTVGALLAVRALDCVAVVVAPDDERAARLPRLQDPRVRILPLGGATRRDTVLAGLDALDRDADDDTWALVHDAARPGVSPALVEALIEVLDDDPIGGLLALPVVDTVKRVADGRVERTEPREAFWLAQTPQMFRLGLLRTALRLHADVTDEAQAIEAMQLRARVVPGSRRNLKVTVPEDLALLRALWDMA